MPTLAKLLDCLKWPKAAGGGTPVRPRGEVVPVADADLAFGWQGYLFATNLQTGILAANTIGASVTVPDDCFYIMDATGLATDFAGVGSNTKRAALEILDPSGVIAWQLPFTWVANIQTAVGVAGFGSAGDYSMRLHLLALMVVRWKLLDATTTTQGVFSSGVALRKLFEENL